MKQVTHYSKFFDWLFDGNRKSPIPTGEPDILKYNSPINETFVLKMFIKIPKLNHYLNGQFNNMGLRYLDREDLFIFIKQCVFDFKVRRNDIQYFPYKPIDNLSIGENISSLHSLQKRDFGVFVNFIASSIFINFILN